MQPQKEKTQTHHGYQQYLDGDIVFLHNEVEQEYGKGTQGYGKGAAEMIWSFVDEVEPNQIVIANDGYTIEVERCRVEDPDYPMILAYAYDGVEVPSWEMGFRIAVLPEDGTVSNEEYGVESAGSYWVKNVVRLVLRPH